MNNILLLSLVAIGFLMALVPLYNKYVASLRLLLMFSFVVYLIVDLTNDGSNYYKLLLISFFSGFFVYKGSGLLQTGKDKRDIAK